MRRITAPKIPLGKIVNPLQNQGWMVVVVMVVVHCVP